MVLEIRRIGPEWADGLAAFFAAIREAGDCHFRPHPFTPEFAQTLSCYQGMDLYYVLVGSSKVVGYGMLRGWDEGYQIPSLGIAIHPEYRGKHFGGLMMGFLHAAARFHGARRVRLKVYAENESALAMYRKLGYRFDLPMDKGQLVGVLEL